MNTNENSYYQIKYSELCSKLSHTSKYIPIFHEICYYEVLNHHFYIDTTILLHLRDLLWRFDKHTNTYTNVLNQKFISFEHFWDQLDYSNDNVYQLHHVKAIEYLMDRVCEYVDTKFKIAKKNKLMFFYGFTISSIISFSIGTLLYFF